jgi:pseudouridine kinase
MSNSATYLAVIGGANIDIHGTPSSGLTMNDSNPGTVNICPGGVARNIAENLARLEIDVRLIAAVGDDPYGNLLLGQGQEVGINTSHMLQVPSGQTSTYLSVVDKQGDMLVAISDMTIVEALTPAHLLLHGSMLKQAKFLILDTNLNDKALAHLFAVYGDQTIFVDTVSTSKAARIRPYLGSVHTLKPGLLEAEALAGIQIKSNEELPKLADWFHDQGVQQLFITLGENGVFYSTQEGQGLESVIPVSSQQINNAGGAGDAFVAGLAYAWLHKWALVKSVRFAMSAAASTLLHSATNNPAFCLANINAIYKSKYEFEDE